MPEAAIVSAVRQ